MAREIKDYKQAILLIGERYNTDLTAVYNLLHDKHLESEEKRTELAVNLIGKIMNLRTFLDHEKKMQEDECSTIG